MRSLSVRLAFSYAILFAISFLLIATISYLVLTNSLMANLDKDLVREISEYVNLLDKADMSLLEEALNREAESEGVDAMFLRIINAAYEPVASSDMTAWDKVTINKRFVDNALDGERIFETVRYENHTYPIRVTYEPFGPGYAAQVGFSTEEIAHTTLIFRETIGLASLMFFFCALLLGALMTHGAIRRVGDVTQTARSISAGDWSSRVPVSGRADELDDLAKAFNEMIVKVAQLLTQIRRVSDDIAHDLRTPITRIRGTAEAVLNTSNKNDEQLAPLGEILQECDQLDYMINTMLQIARMEEGVEHLERECVDIGVIVADVFEFFGPSADDKSIKMHFQAPGAPLYVSGERSMLARVVAHFLDNAVKYADTGGTIDISCTLNGKFVEVVVADSGPGIPEDQLDLIFERFHRVESSRHEKGYGLGLSISRAIARAHGGDIYVESAVGNGSVFVLRLPVS